MTSILAFDPGESTGWCYKYEYKDYTSGKLCTSVTGGTLPKDRVQVAQAILERVPTFVVLERFNLYPQMAKSLAWNSFYPCEVIGVIKYICTTLNITVIEQAPSVKKYFGGFQADWEQVKQTPGFKLTEHVKDAYQHLKYFERNGLRKFQASELSASRS